MINQHLVTTTNNLDGYRITNYLGVVRGITVRKMSILSNFSGKPSIFVDLCERTREEAFQLMVRHGNEKGANAIINMRYNANDIMNGITEVLAYGTAVIVEKVA